MSSGKKAQKSFDAKSLSRKEQLWLPATPEKATFYTHFYQPRFEIILMLSFYLFLVDKPWGREIGLLLSFVYIFDWVACQCCLLPTK
jgi:hypothetical protein